MHTFIDNDDMVEPISWNGTHNPLTTRPFSLWGEVTEFVMHRGTLDEHTAVHVHTAMLKFAVALIPLVGCAAIIGVRNYDFHIYKLFLPKTVCSSI